MMQIKNIGTLINAVHACANFAATAGGTGDNTLVQGSIFDRLSNGSPQSSVVAVPFSATLAEGETLSLTCAVQEGMASDLSDAEVLQTETVVAATGPTGGGTVTGCYSFDVPLRGAGRYVRAEFTPNLSAANTDTAELAVVLICGGMDRLPA